MYKTSLIFSRRRKTAVAITFIFMFLLSSISSVFTVSAASYKFTESFNDNKFPKAVSVYVASKDGPDKCYGFTENQPMIDSMTDNRTEIMMKNITNTESHITYEFKEGFSDFEYVGYGGGQWGGMYGKSGLFKVQWSDSLNGTYRDFKQVVVGPNKGKTATLQNGEMTLDRPDQSSAGLCYFYSNKIPVAAKYLRIYFKASAEEGDNWYANWMAALVSLKVSAYGADPNPTTTVIKPTQTNKTSKPVGNASTVPTVATGNGNGNVNVTTTDEPEPSSGESLPEDSQSIPTSSETRVENEPSSALSTTNKNISINESWKTITLPKGTIVSELAASISIKGGYEIKLFDGAGNQINSSSAKLTGDMLLRLYKDNKVVYTYTLIVSGNEGLPLWSIVLIIIGAIVVAVGVTLLIVFRKKLFGGKNSSSSQSA